MNSKRQLRGLRQMQFGSFPKGLKAGCVVLFTVLGANGSFAQLGQALGGATDQTACNPNDPTCQTYNSNPVQTQSPTNQVPANPQGIVLQPGQTDQTGINQQVTQTQQQQLQQRQALQNLPLDSPTEFQQMVANSIGKTLPIYGAYLFRNPPSTFAPLNMVPVTPDYVIGPGDELLIQAWGQVTLNGRFTVDRSGSIYIPQVGTLHVAGLKFAQIQDYLKAQMSRLFRNFDLNVNMGQLRSIQVFVVGQARRPGSYTISSLSTLVSAIFTTGGPALQGSMRHIQLKRDGRVIVDFDLYNLLERGDKTNDVQLLPGDVIYIPPVGPQVAVAGSVKAPAIYELRSATNSTVGDVVELAAGLTSVAAQEQIRLERVDERRIRSISEVTLDGQGLNTILHDGDLLEFDAIVDQYKDAVTLRGNVANPGRYAWKPGMRVRDLIPDKNALITRDYWLKRSQLGQPMMSYIPTCLPTTPYGVPSLRYGIPVGEEGENPYWRYSSTKNPYLIGMVFGYSDGNTIAPPPTPDDGSKPMTDGGLDCTPPVSPSATSFGGVNNLIAPSSTNLNQSALPNSMQQNPQQNTFGTSQTTPGSYSGLASASVAPAIASASSGQFRPRNDVKLTEPDIDWSYAVIERQSKENLTTSLVPFNLGRLVLEGDVSQNVELMPGDVVTIFSKADIRVPQGQQTKFVRLEGEFVSAGVYSVQPGETLRQLVKRAGGLTPDAYLYGAEFTRESTRREQQQQLNEYINQIALQASTVASANASRSINPQDATAVAAAQQQNQNIVNSLKQARSTGRIVLGLRADSNSISELPDLPLEDGDRFIVPRFPQTVNVDGAVYSQGSYVYDPRLRVGDYIRLAGGANRDADTKRAYIIRAGGSVVSKQYSSSLRGNSFESLHVNQGDTIVVPLNLDKGKTMRMVVDIAQIVGQFGIAIAAANTVLGQ